MPYFQGKKLAAVAALLDCLREIGGYYAKTPAQVALRWLMQQENVLPIPGAKNAHQAAANAAALSFSLSAAEVETLTRAAGA